MSSKEYFEHKAQELDEALRRQLMNVKTDREVLKKIAGDLSMPSSTTGGISGTQLVRSLAAIEAGENQGQILNALVREVGGRARGAAIVLMGFPESTVLAGPGLGLPPGSNLGAKKVSIPVHENSVIARAAMNREVIAEPFRGSTTDTALYQALGQPQPKFMAAIPMAEGFRSRRTVNPAVLYHDNDLIRDSKATSCKAISPGSATVVIIRRT